jgi:hypothetical protein
LYLRKQKEKYRSMKLRTKMPGEKIQNQEKEKVGKLYILMMKL